jgi:hypothetical protein
MYIRRFEAHRTSITPRLDLLALLVFGARRSRRLCPRLLELFRTSQPRGRGHFIAVLVQYTIPLILFCGIAPQALKPQAPHLSAHLNAVLARDPTSQSRDALTGWVVADAPAGGAGG